MQTLSERMAAQLLVLGAGLALTAVSTACSREDTPPSNPEAPQVQHAVTGGRSVAGSVLSDLRALNGDSRPMGSYGAVVGATIGSTAEDLDINGPLLVPGFGAQGGTVDDVTRLFDGVLDRVIVSTSRGVLAAGPDVDALRGSATTLNESFAAALN